MSYIKKIIVSGIMLVLLTLGTMGVAFASETVPYGGYGCHFYNGQDDVGTAYTDRCSCNPVNNYLAARVKIQYLDGNQYKTTSWTSWKTGYNVQTSFIRKSKGTGTYCNYIWGGHKARCGNGNTVQMNSSLGR